MKPLIAASAAVALLAASAPALAASGDWRQDARPEDAHRLGRLDEAWTTALRQARASGFARDVARLGALAQPRAALPRPEPAPGPWRCRTVKLGSPGGQGLNFVAYGWFRCRVELTPGGDLILEKTTGSQRPRGHLYPQSRTRQVFLGAVAWGDDAAAVYGRDPERDQVGVFERIGRQRYRLVLPFPKQESTLDIIELAR